MTELFQTLPPDNLELYSLATEQYDDDSCYPFIEDDSGDLDLLVEAQNDETSSLDQSFTSPSPVPNSPNSTESSTTEPDQDSPACHTVIFPSYAASKQEDKMPAIKVEPVDSDVQPVVCITPTTTTAADAAASAICQPAAKRARSAIAQQSVSTGVESKIPDLLNPENLSSYIQSLAKGKSEDIELFRNVLRCNGSLTPETEKQLKHIARQVKNRESAQLSRQRKREFVQTLKNVIDKMKTVDNTLRSDLNSAQNEAAQYKAETERWENYAYDLQKILQEHGIEVPKIPEAPTKLAVVPSHIIPQVVFPEVLFDGPCGFGHMSPAKCTSGKRRTRTKKVKEQKETKA